MAVTMFRGVPLWLCPCYVNHGKVLCDLWTSWNLSVVPVFNQPGFRHLGWKLVSRSTKMQRSHSWKAGKAQNEARNFELGSFEVRPLPWDFPVILQLHMRINWVRRIEPATAAIACSGRIFQYSALIHVLWVHFSITLSTFSPTSVWAQAILFCF